jgi:2,3-dihydroxybenzoate decarboxylase
VTPIRPDRQAHGRMEKIVKKIALEEHFLVPGFEIYWSPTFGDVDANIRNKLQARLEDFGDSRLETMDRAGIERCVLSIAGPGVQVEPQIEVACRKAREANDILAREIQRRPNRYSGFAHLAMQDPMGAASELERAMRELGFCGAMINGHTCGRYLDDPCYDPFWERAEELEAPIYLHPADPPVPYAALAGYNALTRATWGWGVETGSHALRLIFHGTFDRFPKAKLLLGHLGETLPFLLWRFDSRAKLYGVQLAKHPSDYIRENIAVTTSGMFAADPLLCTLNALGRQRVMFSADYPFESVDEAAEFIDNVALDTDVREDICFNNARRLLRL